MKPHLSKAFERIIYNNKRIRGKQTFKIYSWFQKIEWNSTFYGNHSKKHNRDQGNEAVTFKHVWYKNSKEEIW